MLTARYIPFEVPPRWIHEPRDTALMLGNAIVVNCQADGFPEPDISWFKGGKFRYFRSHSEESIPISSL